VGNPGIRPGDSVVVHVGNPEGSLAMDPHTGMGPAVYAWVSVRPQGQPGKDGAALSGDPSRWPLVDSLTYGGDMWYSLRMDTSFAPSGIPDTAFCVDLNDNLFTPGDTIYYVFSATGDVPAVETTYYSRFTGTTDDVSYAFNNAMEFTCLPTQKIVSYPASSAGVEILPILYVDVCDGRGVQPYFDAAFDELGIARLVDRYDVLAPAWYEANTPAGRVVDVSAQLMQSYSRIIWSTGNLHSDLLGEGYKADDAALLKTFLDQVSGGGVFFTGDDMGEEFQNNPNAATLKSTYIDHTLASWDHVSTYGISPVVNGIDGGIFDHAVEDQWIAYGGCPTISEFDLLTPQGAAVTAAEFGAGPHAAMIVQETANPVPGMARVVLSGVSFENIQSVVSDGQPTTRSHVLWDILMYLNSFVFTDVHDGPSFDSLAQNVPNPFNPTTTIEFSVKERAPVTLRIYNVRGQLVKTLVNEVRAPEVVHRIEWDGRNDAGQQVASGVYFYRLVAKDFVKTRKMVLLK